MRPLNNWFQYFASYDGGPDSAKLGSKLYVDARLAEGPKTSISYIDA